MLEEVRCSVPGCNNDGKYALYELTPKLKKVWRTDLCSKHEKQIVINNRYYLIGHTIRDFKELPTKVCSILT